MKKHSLALFKKSIWSFYKDNGRNFAWRNINNPYYVVVSEIMLQQTQTRRVIEKYEQFIIAFGSFQELAQATLRDVLTVWQGLGYYRRARYLYQIAQKIVDEYDGILPQDLRILETFPGIGPATASSICAFAFNMPTIFIETNIRTVFIHYFFQDQVEVKDKELIPLIIESLDYDNPREWYYALMDYGVFLKAQYGNPSRKSAHYTKQSMFEGSDRQIRAKILKTITTLGIVKKEDLFAIFSLKEKERIGYILEGLEKEQFITCASGDMYTII